MKHYLIVSLAVLVIVMIATDLRRAFRTGRVSTWMDGGATREGQPRKFWRYVYQGYIGIVFFVLVALWVLLDPGRFQ